jgi:hypothetical protein
MVSVVRDTKQIASGSPPIPHPWHHQVFPWFIPRPVNWFWGWCCMGNGIITSVKPVKLSIWQERWLNWRGLCPALYGKDCGTATGETIWNYSITLQNYPLHYHDKKLWSRKKKFRRYETLHNDIETLSKSPAFLQWQNSYPKWKIVPNLRVWFCVWGFG